MPDASSPSPGLLQVLVPRRATGARLFCLPYAGGGVSVFRGWGDGLGKDVEVWGVQLPGREERLLEPPLQRLDDVLDVLVPAVLRSLDRPFALFGHSMGAIISFELARALLRLNAPAPRYLFVSGCVAPHRRTSDGAYLHELEDAELTAELRRLRGTPGDVIDNAELMTLLLPALRADIALSETYRYRPGAPLTCPVAAFGGDDDPDVGPDDLRAWSDLTVGPFDLETFPGDHFFFTTARDVLPRGIGRRLQARLPGAREGK